MRPLFIRSVGALASVGDTAPLAMGALLTEAQLFDDLPVGGPRGEPVTGAVAPIEAKIEGVDRLAALGFLALEQLEAPQDVRRPLPVCVCAPDLPEIREQPRTFIDALTAELPFEVDRDASRVVPRGRAGFGEAIAWARERASAGHPCCLLGVDSLVLRRRVRRLIDAGLVAMPQTPDGMVPGEAAAALLLSGDGATEGSPLAAITGVGFTDAPARDGDASAAPRALPRVAERALADAGVDPGRLTAIAYDAAPRPLAFDEIALAMATSPLDRVTPARTFTPCLSTGEIGAAAAVLSVAMLSFFQSKGVLDGPALALLDMEPAARGAIILQPTR